MGVLLAIVPLSLLGWSAFCTVRAFRRKHVGAGWWLFLGTFLLGGIATGIWSGFMLEYQASPSLRFGGFPFPMVIFQLESGTWIDYVHEQWIMILIGLADVMLVALGSVIPVSAVFYVHRFLQKRKPDVRT